MTLRGWWGSIYSPHHKKSRCEAFHRTSPVDLPEVWQKASGSRSHTGQVWCHHQTSPEWLSGVRQIRLWNPVSDRTSPVPPPDKSVGSLKSDPAALESGGFIGQVW
jgi:hypothetical protein